jgi:hypothetical protein
MKSDGPGEIIYFHCNMRKEEEVKVHIFAISDESGAFKFNLSNGLSP